MRKLASVGILAVALAAALAESAVAAGGDMARWSHTAPIQVEGAPQKGVVEFTLKSEVFDLARPDLADLRVVSDTRQEAPYVLRATREKRHKVPLQVRLYNRTYLSGRQSSVTVDFGQKVMKNRIEVLTPGANFRRKVLIEGSDDGTTWQKVRDGAFLFRIGGGPGAASFDKNTITLPPNDQRYLRITVYNAPDDPERIDIRDLRASHVVHERPETAPVPILSSEVAHKEKEHATEITLDLGHRKLPLYEVQLRFGEANFFRRVSIAGRNSKERIVRTLVEDGSPREERVEEPWSRIASGAVYRYSSGGSVEESLLIKLTDARYRYLRVRIDDGDDPPLRFEGAEINRLVYYLAFQPKWEGDYTLYVGNASARLPRYDIVHYIDRLRGEGVFPAEQGEVGPNPTFAPPSERLPWGERYKGIIWIVLLGVLAVLGLLVYRQIKSAPAASE